MRVSLIKTGQMERCGLATVWVSLDGERASLTDSYTRRAAPVLRNP